MIDKKKILVVEDDPEIYRILQQFLPKYPQYTINKVTDARMAMEEISKGSGQGEYDAIILDIMLPYGSPAPPELDNTTDPIEEKTGIRLLRWLRETMHQKVIWVAVITALAVPWVSREVRPLIEQRGRLYFKPLDDLRVEHELATALGVQSLVPVDLQPTDDAIIV